MNDKVSGKHIGNDTGVNNVSFCKKNVDSTRYSFEVFVLAFIAFLDNEVR